MRLLFAFAAAALLAAPAIAQRVVPAPPPTPAAPPPEGFYKDIPNAYDLLERLEVVRGPTPVTKSCSLRPGQSTDAERKAYEECKKSLGLPEGLEPYRLTPSAPRN